MTARRLLLCTWAVVAFWAQPALPQTVSVRSGEHSTFSRLVFPDQPGREWSVTRRDHIVEIEFSDGAPLLSLDAVFNLIPQDRLADVSFVTGSLRLSLNCDCPVEVQQIPSGHIVIDIKNAPTVMASFSPAKPASRVTMKSEPLSFPVLAALRRHSNSEHAPPILAEAVEDAAAPQLRRHPMGHVPLVPDARPSIQPNVQVSSCTIETLARDILTSDPPNALSDLLALRGQMLTGEDTLDQQVIEKLILTYLQVGWGAEAAALVAIAPKNASEIVRIASALDGMTPPPNVKVDPGCGAAEAVVALLSGVGSEAWKRADEAEVIRLLDSFSDQRWRDLGRRINDALERLNREEILIGLRPDDATDTLVASTEETAAGTNAKAIAASIQLLETANRAGEPAQVIYLENARALRPSIPIGDLRNALDQAVLEALVIRKIPGLVTEMVANGQAQPADILDLVTKHHSPEDRVDFIIRLEPLMAADDPIRRRARDALLALDLRDAARRFAALPQDELPVEAVEPLTKTEPWLARDFPTLAAVQGEERTARNILAAAIMERNAATSPQTDLANADRALTQSSEIGDLIRQLLNPP